VTGLCDICDVGSYVNVSKPPWPTTCIYCPPGSISQSIGSATCIKCDAEEFSDPTRTSCGPCQPGQYWNNSACESCSAGRFAPIPIKDQCIECSAGFSTGVSEGSSSCSSCDAGKYSTGSAIHCQDCPIGTYSETRADVCTDCEAGTAAPTNGSSSCTNCEGGKYAPSTGYIYCTDCNRGYYSETRATECTVCDIGTYAPNNGSNACLDCGAGTIAPHNNSYECTDCAVGRYQSESGKTVCRDCARGTFSDTTGNSACSNCGVGKYVNITAATDCESCTAGQFQSAPAQISCFECEAGKYQDGEAEGYCRDCPTGYYSSKGATACLICDAGYWFRGFLRLEDDSNIGVGSVDEDVSSWGGMGCDVCPANGKCGGGLCLPLPREGYWSEFESKDPDATSIMYPCPNKGCLGGSDKTLPNGTTGCPSDWLVTNFARRLNERQLAAVDQSTNATNITIANDDGDDDTVGIGVTWDDDDGLAVCSEGSGGPLCAACESSWFPDSKTLKCEECAASTVFDAVINIAILISASLIVLGPRYMKQKFGYQIHIPFFKSLGCLDSGSLKVIWSTIQIVSSIGLNLEMTYPEPMASFDGFSTTLKLDFLSADCMQDTNFHDNVYFMSAFPVILFAVIWANFFLGKMFRELKNKVIVAGGYVLDELLEEDWNRANYEGAVKSTLLVAFLFLPVVSLTQFKALNCFTYTHSDQSFLKVDTSIDCNGTEHHTFIKINVCLMFCYQSLVAMFIYLLLKYKPRINPILSAEGNPTIAMRLRDSDRSIDHIRFLFDDVRCAAWYHEVLDLYRRIMFIAIIPLCGQNPIVKGYIGACLSICSMIYYREISPYRFAFTNVLATVAQYQILIIYLSALLMQTGAMSTLGLSAGTLGSIMLCTNLMILIGAGYIAYRNDKEQERLKLIREAGTVAPMEYAVHFNDKDFESIIENLNENSVPRSDLLVYHYTSLKAGQKMTFNGIPCFKDHGYDGIVFTTRPPMEMPKDDVGLEHMSPFSPSREAVLMAIIPKALLHPLTPALKPSSLESLEDMSLVDHHTTESLASKESNQSSMNISQLTGATGKTGGSMDVGAFSELKQSAVDSEVTSADSSYFSFSPRSVPKPAPKGKLGSDLDGDRAPSIDKPAVDRSHEFEDLYILPLRALHSMARTPDGEDLQIAMKKWGINFREQKTPFEPPITVPSRRVIRAYQLVEDNEEGKQHEMGGDLVLSELVQPPNVDPLKKFRSEFDSDAYILNTGKKKNRPGNPIVLSSYKEYIGRMNEIRHICDHRGLVPLYHYTSVYVSSYIFNGGLRVSTEGKGGVHFSTQSPASYDVGSADYEKNVILDCFGEDQLEECREKKKADVCFVYAAEPSTLRQAPGGRQNAKMFPKAYFEAFAREDFLSGDYFLRNDRIMTAFLLDDESLPLGAAEMKEEFLLEKERDARIAQQLEALEAEADAEAQAQAEQLAQPIQMRYKLKRTDSMDISDPQEVLKKRVKLFGFSGKHEPLNGRKGEAMSFSQAHNTYSVALDTSTFERGHAFFVRGNHLELMDPREDKEWRYAQSTKNTINPVHTSKKRVSFKNMESQLMTKQTRSDSEMKKQSSEKEKVDEKKKKKKEKRRSSIAHLPDKKTETATPKKSLVDSQPTTPRLSVFSSILPGRSSLSSQDHMAKPGDKTAEELQKEVEIKEAEKQRKAEMAKAALATKAAKTERLKQARSNRHSISSVSSKTSQKDDQWKQKADDAKELKKKMLKERAAAKIAQRKAAKEANQKRKESAITADVPPQTEEVGVDLGGVGSMDSVRRAPSLDEKMPTTPPAEKPEGSLLTERTGSVEPVKDVLEMFSPAGTPKSHTSDGGGSVGKLDDVLGVFDPSTASPEAAPQKDPLEALADEEVGDDDKKPIALPDGERPAGRRVSPRASRFLSLDDVPRSAPSDEPS